MLIAFFSQGATLKFQSVHDPPGGIWLNQIPGTDEYEFSGKHPEIWFALQVNRIKLKLHSIRSKYKHIFQERLNFTYTVKTPKDGAWGVVNEDGSWTGMIGSLINKDCDVGKYKCNYSSQWLKPQYR